MAEEQSRIMATDNSTTMPPPRRFSDVGLGELPCPDSLHQRLQSFAVVCSIPVMPAVSPAVWSIVQHDQLCLLRGLFVHWQVELNIPSQPGTGSSGGLVAVAVFDAGVCVGFVAGDELLEQAVCDVPAGGQVYPRGDLSRCAVWLGAGEERGGEERWCWKSGEHPRRAACWNVR